LSNGSQSRSRLRFVYCLNDLEALELGMREIKRPVLPRVVVGKAERLGFGPGLSEAIRQLVELGLKAKGKR
jgi:hypothetical protein